MKELHGGMRLFRRDTIFKSENDLKEFVELLGKACKSANSDKEQRLVDFKKV
jgi:hypothetical protein